jgi:hypothetical protein
MIKTESQTPKVVWKITSEFCPRLIVADGLILRVSTADRHPFSGSKFWLPSSTEFITSECFYRCQQFKSVVVEHEAKLERIGPMGFSETAIQFVRIPASVTLLGAKCFNLCESLLGAKCFNLCDSIESGSRLSRIEESAFGDT